MPGLIPIEEKRARLLKRFPNCLLELIENINGNVRANCGCGTEFEASWGNIYSGNSPHCNECRYANLSGQRRRSSTSVVELLADKGLKYIGGYENKDSSIKVACTKCNIEFFRIFSNIRDAEGGFIICPDCRKQKAQASDAIMSEIARKAWLDDRTTNGSWSSRDFQAAYMDWLGGVLGFKSPQDWYQLTRELLIKNFGNSLLQIFKGSPYAVVKSYLPKFTWTPWLFVTSPKGLFDDPKLRREYLAWLFVELRYQHADDWYKLKAADLMNNKGSGLMARYRNSHIQILKDCLPEIEWLEWKFETVPRKFWLEAANVRRYVLWLKAKLKLNSDAELILLTIEQIKENSGGGLLGRFKCQWREILELSIPEVNWTEIADQHQLAGTSNRTAAFWEMHLSLFVSRVAEQLQILTPEDWYAKASVKSLVKDFSAGALLETYGSLSAILNAAIPGADFKDWLFKRVPKDFWRQKNNRVAYLDWLGEKLSFTKKDNWYFSSNDDFKRNRGAGLLYEFEHSIE